MFSMCSGYRVLGLYGSRTMENDLVHILSMIAAYTRPDFRCCEGSRPSKTRYIQKPPVQPGPFREPAHCA